MLLLNDRFDPDWKVSVDGKPEKLLRCNYLMRGVYLPPGSHTVAFRFSPPTGAFYASVAGAVVGALLLCYLVFGRGKESALDSTDAPAPSKQPRPAK